MSLQRTSSKTLGQTVSDLELSTVAILAGLAVVIVGSLGPWATSPLSSASGIDGDGKLTVALAIVALIVVWRSGRRAWLALATLSALIGVAGIYDAIHIHHVIARYTLQGTQLDHVGWGVYAVIVGAALALTAAVRSRP